MLNEITVIYIFLSFIVKYNIDYNLSPPCSATFWSIDGGTYSCGNSWNISCAP